MKKLKIFLSNRTNAILVGILAIIIVGGLVGLVSVIQSKFANAPLEEITLNFDPEGSFALLIPRRDGDALILSINRVSSYESISYELSYQSTGSTAGEEIGPVDRGAQGEINAKDKKNEYSQEILFGTCSQGYTSGASHCVFDKGVENGTLILKVKKPKEKKLYRMVTNWHLQKADVALGVITSADDHFTYTTNASRESLTTTGWIIVNDLIGAPKLPEGKEVFGKVYALNLPTARTIDAGDIVFELIDNPPDGAKIFRYMEAENKWKELETTINENKLTSGSVEGAGIFAVLVDSKE